ncbi:alpha/beta hydrolase [Marinobacter sp. NP-4(2019)]|nr:alpha/beta hydrolase [Marinobacter sp. NP-4(2019)]
MQHQAGCFLFELRRKRTSLSGHQTPRLWWRYYHLRWCPESLNHYTVGLYAKELAQAGFVTLAFDASYQGESSGEPRQLENPYLRVGDISAAIDYLITLDYVDNDRIGAFGVCAGGGYAINATMADRRIKALGTVSAVNYGDMYRFGWDGTEEPGQCLPFLDLAAQAMVDEANGGATQYLPTTPASAQAAPNADLAEAYEYYRTPRGEHSNAPSRFTTRSLAQLVTFDAFNNAEIFLTQPLLAIAGSDAGTRWMSEAIAERAAGNNNYSYIVEGGTHVGMYDRPRLVFAAMGRLAPFFNEHL